ncbi:ricin-type beta-trefoil lectin domain protein [Streptomyces sp. NPDC059445]|uniref:ricin-type beta-trefoil lectin domain protein n=1 Tax=Streptomyces sp. NPDC059445 TaxID=3346832 RepID=UPI0036CC37F9
MSDERLAAELKRQGGATANYPVGELLDRHWEAVFSYARLCTGGVRPAGMLTTASFTRLFGDSLHQGGPSAAWRPHLLVTVRRIAAEWLMDARRELLDPGLLAETDGADRAAARLLPPENRRLISRAFQRLPEPARCLLWHGEVEAEQPEVPAALLGIFPEDAVTELERARERLRQGCLEIHHELAPSQECRRYHRMLDASFRRGGTVLDPDLRGHMDACGHCRYAADQLSRFNGELAVPLAEAVLGWGAHAYAASRRARAAAAADAAQEAYGDPADGGEVRAGGVPGADGGPATGTAGIVEFLPDADGVRTPGFPPPTGSDVGWVTGNAPLGPEAAVPGPAAPSGPGVSAPSGPGVSAPLGDDRPLRQDEQSFGRPEDRSFRRRDDRPSRRRGASRSGAGTRSSRSAGGGGTRATGSAGGAEAGISGSVAGTESGSFRSEAGTESGSSGSVGGTGTRAARRAAGRKAARRAPGRRNVAVAVLTLGALIMVPLVLWMSDNDADGRHDTADGGRSADAPSRSTDPSWARTGEKKDGTMRGRLRNVATGRCVGFAGTTPAIGAEARLIPCSSESATEWSYGTDGLLRDAAHPGLCLDSHLGYSVQLAPCTDASRPGAKNVRYEFTLQGLLVPRWNPDLALVPASAEGESALVLKLREDEPIQHWTFDPSSPSLQLEVVNWDSTDGDAKGSTTGKPTASATATAGTRTPTATTAPPGHATPSAEPSDGSCASVSASCPGDGLNGSRRDGGYGTGSGSGGYGSFGGGGQGSRR